MRIHLNDIPQTEPCEINFKDKINMFYRIRKLLHNKEMGNIFKVMFAQKKDKKFSLGF